MAKSTILDLSQQLKDSINARTQQLLNEVDDITCQSTGDCVFTFDKNLLDQCKNFGHVYLASTCSPSPSNSHVLGNGVSQATVDQFSYIDIHLLDENGEECRHDDVDCVAISVKLMTINKETDCVGQQVKRDQNIIQYKYTPSKPGDYNLHITLNNMHIKDSPFAVTVGMPLRLRCIQTGMIDGYYKPGGIAVGPNGEIAVADSRGWKTVKIYNSQLELMLEFGDWGGGEGQCYETIGVTFDLQGNILVVDGGNHRIHKFDRSGRHLRTIGEKGSQIMQFLRPTGIGVNKAGFIYVCDRTNNRVQVFKPTLVFDSVFGGYGDEPGNLYNPWGVAFDSQGNVYISDVGHYCIKKFTPYGKFLKAIGPSTTGKPEDELKYIEMICIDEYDYIYVTERQLNKVIVFDTDGNYHTSFGGYGYGKGQFYLPRGIAKDIRSGTLYVSEVGNKRIQKFE
jgi:tripartite motif-containing protein 71